MRTPNGVLIWVSGTATIVGSEVVHPNDLAAQTDRTRNNIAALLSPENFAPHGWPQTGAGLEHVISARVYLKRPEDLSACRAPCERRLGGRPKMYLIADICRAELRVEIEGVAFVPSTRHGK